MRSHPSITRRRQRLLETLSELVHVAGEAVPYATVAQRQGIHNTAAYEMLRLLEKEGYVSSDYVLSGNAGPGRSSVVFRPTARGYAVLGLAATSRDSNWETTKGQILARLGQDDDAKRVLAEELLARMPDLEEPLVYCAGALTALLLNVGREARQRLDEQIALLERLMGELPTRPLLGLLPGIALGLTLPAPAQRMSEKLIECSERCQTYLQELDEAKQIALADFVRQVMETLPGAQQSPEEHASLPVHS